MADSNIDYGHGWFALNKYLKLHPDTKLAGEKPETGKIVIGVNDYLDLNNTNKFNWLKQYSPVGHVNFCFLLFNIQSPKPDK